MVYVLALVYGIIYALLGKLTSKYYLAGALFLFFLVIFFYFKKKDKLEIIGLKNLRGKQLYIYRYLPLLVIVLINFLNLSTKDLYLDLGYVLVLLMSVVFEELLFRGYILYKFNYTIKGAIISSFIFSVFHLVTLWNIGNVVYIIFGLVFAFLMGLCFFFYFMKDKSLLLLILFHFLINLSSFGIDALPVKWMIFNIFISVLILLYTYLTYKGELDKEN